MTLLRIDDLRVDLGGRPVVRGISLQIEPSEVLALLGPSGCGKTTTLRTIAGLQRATAGSIQLADRPLSGAQHVPPEARGIGLVFQDGAVFPHLSVRRNLAFGLPRAGAETERRVEELVELLALQGLTERLPHQLSGGQRQRVALGRALAPRPQLLLLDEPFASLDAALKVSLRGELFALLRRVGTSALLVTHDQDEALEVADRVAVMREGLIEQLATPSKLLDQPATAFVAEFVSGASLVPVDVQGGCVTVGEPIPVQRADGPAFAVLRADDLAIAPTGWSGEVIGRRVRGGRTLSRVRLSETGAVVEVPGDLRGDVTVAPRSGLLLLPR